ncbi:MAG: hypothetical protein M3Y85_05960 [Bacteroidota bacterium]|nr:hypothetical protein [Bacteroidota bacterium]
MSYPFQLLIIVLLFLSSLANAQTSTCKPPIGRVLWHDKIDKAQKKLVELKITAGDNEDLNYFVNQAITKRIDAIQCEIETDGLITDQPKKGYLAGLENLLKNFYNQYRSRQVTAAVFPATLNTFEKAMALDKKGESIEPIVENSVFEVSNLLVGSGAFANNVGMKNAKFHLVYKHIQLHPDKTFSILKDNPDVPFRDSLIKIAGHINPRQLYDYAAADNRLGYAIRAIDDPYIRTVSKMAKSSSGQLYFPFLHNILKGSQTIAEIDAVKNDPVKYYKLLVKTKMDYVQSGLEGGKITEMEALSDMLEKKAIETFIKPINELHESENLSVRFKALEPLNSQELYYLIIAGERDLYTSSYLKGVYPKMMQRIGNRGDSLLVSVNFDHFKKFIKMAAGYATLADFLASFPQKDNAVKTLMRAFVNGLDKSVGLEDGVDVADSYASISETLKPVADEMLDNVKRNYEYAAQNNNKRGMVIYDLLYKLFQSATDSTIDLSKEFNIPPVYSVSYKALAGDTGKVVMQVFFYGDKDGRWNYNTFIPQFPSALWKRFDTKQWVSFTSTKGKSIVVYANKPLDEESGEVDRAQAALCDYLSEKNLNPTIVVHRGHSYYAPYTIEQLAPSAKIVFLGSCGGYHLIHDVLERAGDAHIIASKQIGKQIINQPFFDLLNEKLRTGNNIEWIPFWKEFKAKAGKTEGFDDYIPPHKNLGAIFIKAYKNAMGDSGEGI